jgi:hypothetical protein
MTLAVLLGIWIVAVVVLALVRRQRRCEGSGLLYAYFLNLWTIHWLGAAVYLLPWFRRGDVEVVQLGFEQSTYGIVAFVVGCLVVAPLLDSSRSRSDEGDDGSPAASSGVARYYLIVGGLAYLFLGQLRLPTLGAIVAAGQQLLVAGLCLKSWWAWQAGRTRRLAGWLGLSCLLPIFTIVHTGFLAYGAIAALLLFVFVGSFFRPRWKMVAVALVVAYAGLSFYVSYMRDRTDIRETVWGGRPLDERIEQLTGTVTSIEWFDPGDVSHLAAIDERLNQNYLVGMAVDLLSRTGAYAHGETLVDGALALVPRVVWPEKAIFAGSGDLVSRFTGLRFREGTSVGIGTVLELYANFGTVSVMVGFMLLGVLMTALDAAAHRELVQGRWDRFTFWFLAGMSFLQVGGALVEVAGTAGASVVASLAVNRLYRYVSTRRTLSAVSSPRRPLAAPVP